MASKQASAAPGSRRWIPGLVRLGVFSVLAVGAASLLGQGMRWDARRTEPAGFGRGLLHGAAMPLAWPGLLAGRDATIYADRNTGRTYKLGYTLGVNVCGALFFGWSYRRISRIRRRVAGEGSGQ